MGNTYTFLKGNEQIIKEGKANMQLGIKNVNLGLNKSGKLILTNSRLIFVANGFNLGNKYDEINLSDVVVSGKGFNIGLGIGIPIPVVKVTTKDGKTRQFVVEKKEKADWEEQIAQATKSTVHNGSNVDFVCSKCGYHSEKIFKFCPECGSSKEIEHNCPNCGTAYNDGQKFCLECGQALQV